MKALLVALLTLSSFSLGFTLGHLCCDHARHEHKCACDDCHCCPCCPGHDHDCRPKPCPKDCCRPQDEPDHVKKDRCWPKDLPKPTPRD